MENLIGCRQVFVSLLDNRRAVTAIEYALIASLVAVAVVTGAKAIGVDLATTFNNVSTHL
jgi:pilus assembly protein Flp/PilA